MAIDLLWEKDKNLRNEVWFQKFKRMRILDLEENAYAWQ